MLKKILNAVIILSFILSMGILMDRNEIESGSRQIELMINTDDLKAISNYKQENFDHVLERFKEAGISTILMKEVTLGELERSKAIEVIPANQLIDADAAREVNLFNENNLYLKVNDSRYGQQIRSNLEAKEIGFREEVDGVEYFRIPIKPAYTYENPDGIGNLGFLDKIGVGFDKEMIDKADRMDFDVVTQLRSWKNYTEESIDEKAAEVAEIDNLSFVFYNDAVILGYPGKDAVFIEKLAQIKGREIPVGTVEFFNQKGIAGLGRNNDYQVVRIHSISDKEMLNFTMHKAMDRYILAAKERNIRALYIKTFGMNKLATAEDANLKFIGDLKAGLEKEGFEIKSAAVINRDSNSMAKNIILGLGVVAAMVLIFINKKTPKLGYFLGALALVGYLGILYLKPSFAQKVMGFASVIIFPTYAMVLFFDIKKGKGRNILNTLASFTAISLITFAGGAIMAALLSYSDFMLKIDQFMGVKLAHLIPLIIIPILVILWNREGLETVKKILNAAIEYKVVILGGIGLLALAYYLLRTGNEGTALVSSLESRFRDELNTILGVRPRTKEFLIGHPFMVLLLYMGINYKNWYLIFPAIIGQVSLANTYAHLHTPIAISLQRSAEGIIIGLVLGLILIAAYEILKKIYFKYLERLLS